MVDPFRIRLTKRGGGSGSEAEYFGFDEFFIVILIPWNCLNLRILNPFLCSWSPKSFESD